MVKINKYIKINITFAVLYNADVNDKISTIDSTEERQQFYFIYVY